MKGIRRVVIFDPESSRARPTLSTSRSRVRSCCLSFCCHPRTFSSGVGPYRKRLIDFMAAGCDWGCWRGRVAAVGLCIRFRNLVCTTSRRVQYSEMQCSRSLDSRAMHATKERDGLGVIDCAGGNATGTTRRCRRSPLRGDDVVEAMCGLWSWVMIICLSLLST